jgi:hypothetical protein
MRNFIASRNQVLIATMVACCLLCVRLTTFAQEVPQSADSVVIQSEDTVAMKSYAARFNPRKALLYAAVVPGLGQVYNKKYWKLPLVYGGFIAVGWNIDRFHTAYSDFREQLFFNIEHGLTQDNDENPNTGFTTRQLRSAVDRTRYRRDFWIIMVGAMYFLQIVDAHVDAHLKEFDLNPNLRISFQPLIDRDQILGKQTGASLTIKF